MLTEWITDYSCPYPHTSKIDVRIFECKCNPSSSSSCKFWTGRLVLLRYVMVPRCAGKTRCWLSLSIWLREPVFSSLPKLPYKYFELFGVQITGLGLQNRYDFLRCKMRELTRDSRHFVAEEKVHLILRWLSLIRLDLRHGVHHKYGVAVIVDHVEVLLIHGICRIKFLEGQSVVLRVHPNQPNVLFLQTRLLNPTYSIRLFYILVFCNRFRPNILIHNESLNRLGLPLTLLRYWSTVWFLVLLVLWQLNNGIDLMYIFFVSVLFWCLIQSKFRIRIIWLWLHLWLRLLVFLRRSCIYCVLLFLERRNITYLVLKTWRFHY